MNNIIKVGAIVSIVILIALLTYFFVIANQPTQTVQFSLSLSSAHSTIVPGKSVTTYVAITLIGNTNAAINLSASYLPAAASVSFNQVSCDYNCSSALTISTTPDTPIGTYDILISGTDGVKTNNVSYSLTVSYLSTVLKPVSALCGIKERPQYSKNNWIEMPVNCTDKILEKDSSYYTIGGNSITLNKIPAVEVKFDLSNIEIKKIVNATAEINMACRSYLDIATLTEFNAWNPLPSYFYCGRTKERKTAYIEPQIINNTAYVLITPGTGDSETDVDNVVLSVTYA